MIVPCGGPTVENEKYICLLVSDINISMKLHVVQISFHDFFVCLAVHFEAIVSVACASVIECVWLVTTRNVFPWGEP